MNELSNPLVSIVTPIFNVKSFLSETIESVINQQYTNWELILVDDGSTDGSDEIAKSFAKKYPQTIFYFEHDKHINLGASPSRNLGLSNVRGDIVAFLDSDDVWLPEKLKKQIELLHQNPEASVLCEATNYWSSWSDAQKEDVVVQVVKETDKLYCSPQLVPLVYPLGNGPGFCTCGLIIKKTLIDKIGGFSEDFVGKNQLFEDQVLFMKLGLHGNVYISSMCNNWYRQRPDSLMHGLYTEGYSLEGKRFFLNWLKEYLQEHQILDKSIHRLLKQAYLNQRYPKLFKLSSRIIYAIRKLA